MLAGLFLGVKFVIFSKLYAIGGFTYGVPRASDPSKIATTELYTLISEAFGDQRAPDPFKLFTTYLSIRYFCTCVAIWVHSIR